MRWNTPLSVDHAALLMDRPELGPGVDVLDLGWVSQLMRAVEAGGSGARGVGIDNDEQVLARARAQAEVRGLDRRIDFVHTESATWE